MRLTPRTQYNPTTQRHKWRAARTAGSRVRPLALLLDAQPTPQRRPLVRFAEPRGRCEGKRTDAWHVHREVKQDTSDGTGREQKRGV
jgi:hypothetical protein